MIPVVLLVVWNTVFLKIKRIHMYVLKTCTVLISHVHQFQNSIYFYPGLFSSNELLSTKVWLPCETPMKEPMLLEVISNFYYRSPHGGSNSESFDPKAQRLNHSATDFVCTFQSSIGSQRNYFWRNYFRNYSWNYNGNFS